MKYYAVYTRVYGTTYTKSYLTFTDSLLFDSFNIELVGNNPYTAFQSLPEYITK